MLKFSLTKLAVTVKITDRFFYDRLLVPGFSDVCIFKLIRKTVTPAEMLVFLLNTEQLFMYKGKDTVHKSKK